MKKMKRHLAILLMLAVMLTSFATLGVSAASSPAKPWMVQNLSANAGVNSVTLIWKRSTQNILGYRVWMSTDGKNFHVIKTLDLKRYPSLRNVQNCAYKVPNLKEGLLYRFRVTAYVNGPSGHALDSAYKTVSAVTIREMRYKINIKQGTTLSSHGGNDAGWTIYRGQWITANRFTSGQYVVDHNGGRYHINATRVGDTAADYTKYHNYTRWAAEKFVNDRNYKSATGQFVWVSTYTQHIYLFVKRGGKWKCVDDWECATGKANSPTPTGLNFRKSIWTKTRSRNGLPWWSAFSSWNSFHGRQSDWPVGDPASSGCVRNPNEKAEKIYKGTWMDTSVLIY